MNRPIEYNFLTNGRIRIDINGDCKLDIFPLKINLINKISGDITFECEVHQNWWAETHIFTENCFLSIRDRDGNEIIKDEVIDIKGDSVQSLFHIWSKTNRGKQGLVIGTNDGTSGEWVNPVRSNELAAVLIEPTKETFDKLEKNYRGMSNVKLVNGVVTPNGGDVDFYEIIDGPGYTNSLSKGFLLNFCKEDQIRTVKNNSLSIKDLIKKYGPKWIHIDAEGADAELIKSIFEMDQQFLPETILFEYGTDESSKKLINKASSLGYHYLFGQKLNAIFYR
jgi:FkbM family methyltransferase